MSLSIYQDFFSYLGQKCPIPTTVEEFRMLFLRFMKEEGIADRATANSLVTKLSDKDIEQALKMLQGSPLHKHRNAMRRLKQQSHRRRRRRRKTTFLSQEFDFARSARLLQETNNRSRRKQENNKEMIKGNGTVSEEGNNHGDCFCCNSAKPPRDLKLT